MSEEYKANVDIADVTWPAAGTITARGVFVDGQHFWLNQQEEGPTLADIDEMCKRRNFSNYYDDWGPIDQDSRTVLQSMMNEAITRWGNKFAPPADETMSRIGRAVARAVDEQMPEAVEPIPLSERKPWSEHCLGRPTESSDAGWLWLWFPAAERWQFCAVFHRYPVRVEIPIGATHWLPASTKYLPARVDQ